MVSGLRFHVGFVCDYVAFRVPYQNNTQYNLKHARLHFNNNNNTLIMCVQLDMCLTTVPTKDVSLHRSACPPGMRILFSTVVILAHISYVDSSIQ